MAVTDSSPEEFATWQDSALDRLGHLLEGVDERLPVPGTTWTVRDTLAHLAGAATRYATADPDGMASTPRGVDSLNNADLRSLDGLSMGELLSVLRENHEALSEATRGLSPQDRLPFHAGVTLSPLAAAGEWLGELLIHGHDLARAIRQRWPIRSREALLISMFAFEVLPGYLDVSQIDSPLRVEVRLLGGRPQTISINEDSVTVGDRGDSFPAEVRFLSTPQAWILNGYGRVSLPGAIRRGLLVVGGRRPWRALELQRALVRP